MHDSVDLRELFNVAYRRVVVQLWRRCFAWLADRSARTGGETRLAPGMGLPPRGVRRFSGSCSFGSGSVPSGDAERGPAGLAVDS